MRIKTSIHFTFRAITFNIPPRRHRGRIWMSGIEGSQCLDENNGLWLKLKVRDSSWEDRNFVLKFEDNLRLPWSFSGKVFSGVYQRRLGGTVLKESPLNVTEPHIYHPTCRLWYTAPLSNGARSHHHGSSEDCPSQSLLCDLLSAPATSFPARRQTLQSQDAASWILSPHISCFCQDFQSICARVVWSFLITCLGVLLPALHPN